MKLSEWAKRNGVSYKTAWRWVKQGKFPVPYEQMPSGTILVKEEAPEDGVVAVYARVSASEQAQDLDRQTTRLLEYANSQGWAVGQAVGEVGSGLDGTRPGLLGLLKDPRVKVIVVEERHRLARFGFECIQAALGAQGRRIVVVSPRDAKGDLMADIEFALKSFCSQMQGAIPATNGTDEPRG